MIPAKQPIDEDLEARKIANLQARGEPDLTRTSYTDNHANNGIVRIIGIVITICGCRYAFHRRLIWCLGRVWYRIRVCLFRL